jgi:hypothetical protein
MAGIRAGLVFSALGVAVLVGFVGVCFAQDMPSAVAPAPVPAPVTPAPAPTPAVPAPNAATSPSPGLAPTIPASPQKLGAAQLDQLVAPIALYPDPLLGQVLMASTYPIEVVEAARWARVPAKSGLGVGSLTAALKTKQWDPSVMALVPFPGLLAVMADKLEWTDQLGDAFLAQGDAVMTAVQRLRHAALAAGNLKATPECHCIILTSGDTISILPSDDELAAVPVYNPAVVYGSWADSGHPPVAFPLPPGFAFAPGVAVGFEPAIEVALYRPLWGWASIDWAHRHILVDNARYAAIVPGHPAFADGVWLHDSTPRHPVALIPPAAATHHGHARNPEGPVVRRFAMAHPPRPFFMPRRHALGLPPGTIVPPPPPPHHAAIGWPYDGYRRYW